jgi:uncharacterized protein YceH (UPF0502 family)
VEPGTAATEAAFPLLDAVEARILGSLVEKAAITPEAYPLTENAIVAACNQKTSREPLMQLETGAVAHALRAMQGRGLVRVAPSSQRALRYEHRFDENYGTTARQRAVLCVLLLRGAQTIAELLARTERIAPFPGAEDVRDTLDRLAQREAPLVTCIGRAAGQREDRYMHLLCGPVEAPTVAPLRQPADPAARSPGVHERLDRLEQEVAQLRAELAALKGEG